MNRHEKSSIVESVKAGLIFQFGRFRVDPQARAVMKDDSPVALSRRAFDVLVYFLENPGRPVARDELLENVWPDTHVEENNLNQSISVLRKALGETTEANGCITTLPGFGYQFIAPVSRVGAPDPACESSAVGIPAAGSCALQQQTLTTTVVIEERGTSSGSRWFAGWMAAALLAGASIYAGIYKWKHTSSPSQLHKVVVADFANSTGDPAFDRTLRRALEIDLGQSPYLDVMSEQEGIQTLELMARKSDDAITAAVAREVCLRTNRQVVLTGSIASVGKQYLLTLEATRCDSGAELAAAKAQAAAKEEILHALDSVAEQVRAKLGESVAAVADSELPIQEATTPSLDALKAYSMGQHLEALGDEGTEKGSAVLAFYRQAVELDPQFAMAWGAMASWYGNQSELTLSAQAYQKAFELSHHLTPREKLTIESHYYNAGINDLQRAIKSFQLWALTYPQDWVPWQNLCNDYNELGQRQEAVAAGEQALKLEPGRGNIYNVLIRAYKNAGRDTDAQRLGQEAARRHLDSDAVHAFLFESALNAHNQQALERETKWGEAHGGWFFLYTRAETEAAAGKIHLANESFARSQAIAARENLGETVGSILIDQAQAQYDLGMLSAARATRGLISKDYPPIPDLALLRAELGDVRYAERFLLVHREDTPDTSLNARYLPGLRAVLDLQQRAPMGAVAALEQARRYGSNDYSILTERAVAYLQAAKPNLAVREYKVILASPPAATQPADTPLYNLAHLGLAHAYAMQKKIPKSRDEYELFFKLWTEADQDVPLLQQAKAEYGRLVKGSTAGR